MVRPPFSQAVASSGSQCSIHRPRPTATGTAVAWCGGWDVVGAAVVVPRPGRGEGRGRGRGVCAVEECGADMVPPVS